MNRLGWIVFCGIAAVGLSAAPPANAQDQPTASLLRTSAAAGVREGFSGAVDRIVRARIDGLDVVDVRGQVALDMSEVQLALGCMGETPECLGQVAEQLGVTVLLLPNLDVAGDGLLLSIARFDATGDGTIRRVAGRADGPDSETEILDSVDGLLRELFDLPAAEPEVVDPPREGDDVVTPPIEQDPVTPAAGPDLAGPAVLLAVGGAALIGGGIAAGLFLGEADAYAMPATNPEEVAQRDASRANAETLALAANVLFIGGGVVAAAGLAWLIGAIASSGGDAPPPESAALLPFATPDSAGLMVSGTIPEGR